MVQGGDCMVRHDNSQCPFVTLAYAQSLDGRIVTTWKSPFAQAKEKIRALYTHRPLCLLHCHGRWFHASARAHFAIWPHLHQLQAWICTYGEMITAVWRRRQWMNQHSQMGIAEASLQNIKHLGVSCMAKNLIGCCSQDATEQYEHHIGTILANSRTVPSSSCLVAFKRMGSSTYAIFCIIIKRSLGPKSSGWKVGQGSSHRLLEKSC
jgi:hypothetical protein